MADTDTLIDKRSLRRSFERAAETYDGAAVLQREIGSRMLSRLDYVRLQPSIVLDAGCGTGLCGPLLRPLASRLDGVDLSDKMIALARERAVYDELLVGELCAAMRARPRCYDAIVSADTLVYFGDLAEPVVAAAACLRPGGRFVYTVEAMAPEHAGVGFRITPSGRYEHGREYLETTMRSASFTLVNVERETLRMERGAEVVGWLVSARLPA